MERTGFRKFLCIIALVAFIASCGGSSSSSSGDSGSDVIDTTAGQVFPIDLVVTSPYTQAQASSAMVLAKTLDNFDSERTELQQILEGTTASSCNFTLSLFASPMNSPTCYGPQLSYQNHPDGADQDPAQLPLGDVGIWNESENGEACAAAKVNQLVDSVGTKVESAVDIFASIACSLNVNGDELPAEGTALDLAGQFEDILSGNGIGGIAVSTARLERAANDADGNAVYDFAFTGSASEGSESQDVELYLRHVPLDEDNATYRGKLSFSFSWIDEQGGSVSTAGSVIYHKSSATQLTYRLQQADYVANPGLTVDPLDESNRDIDPTIVQLDNSVTGWSSNFNYALFSVNPQDGTGSYAYAWSAGNDSNTRVFNATVEAADDGTKSGCAYYGYGPRVPANQNLGTIDGMICNWAGPGNDHTTISLVQRQCVAEDANGLFVLDATSDPDVALRIGYAPTNSCDYPGGAFWYTSDAENMTNDVPSSEAAFDNNLLPIVQMSFSAPAVPADVY